jgi:hypothetical protein
MSALAQQWTEKLAAWSDSGLSIAAWCRQDGAGYHQFLYWRKRLEPRLSEGAGRFVTLRVNQSTLRLECSGMMIHIEPGFDRMLLTDLLTVLKQV